MPPLAPRPEPAIQYAHGALFTWRGDQVVLLGDHVAGGWVVARGWTTADRLTDVRRWVFRTPQQFTRQIIRLAREAGADEPAVQAAAAAARQWVTALLTS